MLPTNDTYELEIQTVISPGTAALYYRVRQVIAVLESGKHIYLDDDVEFESEMLEADTELSTDTVVDETVGLYYGPRDEYQTLHSDNAGRFRTVEEHLNAHRDTALRQLQLIELLGTKA